MTAQHASLHNLRRAIVVTIVTGFLASLAGVTPALAAASGAASSTPGISLSGCSGSGTSMSSSGSPLQSATAPNPPSSPSHPLLVDPKGTVTYQGSSTSVITNNRWNINVMGVRVKSGGGQNASHQQGRAGVEKVSDYLPFKFTGLFYVNGSFQGDGGKCEGSVWIKVTGSPVGTIPWIVGIVLAIAGLAGIYFSRPKVIA